ncbi:MAG: methyltransferase family protein [Desulfurivibrionaceae bacterium]
MHTAAERYRLKFSWILGVFLIFFIVFTKSKYELTTTYEFLELLGYFFIVIATLGRIWSSVYIGGRKDEELCKEGPYSITRNPLYIFSFFGAVGIILSAQKIVLIIAIVPFFIYYYFVIIGEEKRLHDLFGDDYNIYSKEVNRVIPKFNLYSSKECLDVYPKIILRSMVHASWFMWIFLILEIIEYLKENTNIIPTLLYLPF